MPSPCEDERISEAHRLRPAVSSSSSSYQLQRETVVDLRTALLLSSSAGDVKTYDRSAGLRVDYEVAVFDQPDRAAGFGSSTVRVGVMPTRGRPQSCWDDARRVAVVRVFPVGDIK